MATLQFFLQYGQLCCLFWEDMHAYRRPIVTVVVHAAQQEILAVPRLVAFGVQCILLILLC